MTAPDFGERPETARGQMLYNMLLETHARIRADLAYVERLASDVLDGLPADTVQEQLEELRGSSMLWQFQLSCLRYCSLVHMHHHAEDTMFFDELEQTNPALRPVVERLRADHRAVSDHLDAVEAATRGLSVNDRHETRRTVAAALEKLSKHLLAHLDYEEQNVAATTRRLREFPSRAGAETRRA
jgi:iron-sulfur cluster repair protein YtfE (RIC family)